jgi:hypothetical protein
LEELLAAESDVTRNSTLRTTYEMFKLFSLGTHSSPLLFSVEEAPGGGWPWKLRRGYVSEGTVEACTVLALHVLKIWGDAVGLDVTNRAGALIARLNSGSKTQPPDSSSGEHRREPIDEWREPSGRVPEGEV